MIGGGRERLACPLAVAKAAAATSGVTRLADITRLDRAGVPVFHAVRPRSRALSLHQGKGLTVEEAQLGALMEAVESATAEAFPGSGRVCSRDELPPTERLGIMADFCRDRGAVVADGEPVAWTEAERLTDGRKVQAPLACVSLDYTVAWDRRLDRTSTGLAARFDFEGAVVKGLLEVLERDAAAAWRRLPLPERAGCAVDALSVPYPWFQEIAERLRAAAIRLSLYRLATVVGLPAVYAELFDPAAAPAASTRVGGWACGETPEAALRGAVLEALQCRLTLIAGARDDILYAEPGLLRAGEACPLPPGMTPLTWARLEDAQTELAGLTSRGIAERLAEQGYPDAAAVRLSAPGDPVCVVKVFAPGLGANLRTRRPPQGGSA